MDESVRLYTTLPFTLKVNFDLWLVSSAPMAELSALFIYKTYFPSNARKCFKLIFLPASPI